MAGGREEMKLEPYPVGSAVEYHGSHHRSLHGRYVITGHEVPREGIPEPELNYPDGVAYVIWREGVLRKFGNRHHCVSQVRRQSLTPAGHEEAPEDV